MGWRDFHASSYMDNMDNMDLMTLVTPLKPYCPFNPPVIASIKICHPIHQTPPRAWLENGQLRVRGVFPGDWPHGGLTPEIIKLTSADLSLQAKLLREIVGAYLPGPHWLGTIRRWRELAMRMFEVKGKDLHAANYKAAAELKLLAFAEELGLKGQSNGELLPKDQEETPDPF